MDDFKRWLEHATSKAHFFHVYASIEQVASAPEESHPLDYATVAFERTDDTCVMCTDDKRNFEKCLRALGFRFRYIGNIAEGAQL